MQWRWKQLYQERWRKDRDSLLGSMKAAVVVSGKQNRWTGYG